jgi:hypothetical protein
MQAVARLHRWHQTRAGLAISGLVEMLLAVGFLLLAIDTGSLLQYFLGFVALVGTLQNFVKFARTFIGGPKATKA